ncbi:MAG TPA: hypothetical protein VFO59_05670 [Dehalococcoidia bacterium]|jgi:hypothetical protein|nr:hypothetical protein [Dehalococcoidia bacterium]
MIWWVLLLGCILAIVPVLWLAGIRKRKSGQTEMIMIGAASGEAEVETWVAALRTAGIQAHVINAGDIRWAGVVGSPYSYEVWVPARDKERAKRALGF